jgi:hypothetical protein
MSSFARWRKRDRRRGNVLVEFALIALVLYLLLAATMEFGRAIYAAQVLQQAADVGARELSRMYLPSNISLQQALEDPQVRAQIFDDRATPYPDGWLVFPLDTPLPDGFASIPEFYAAQAPLVNRLLLPLMVYDLPTNTLRYPGVARNGRIEIPLVSYSGDGTETIVDWVPVLEEIRPENVPLGGTESDYSPFNLLAEQVPAEQRGFVALRLNFPFQAATMTAYARGVGQWPPEPGGTPVRVSDNVSENEPGTYGGPNSLGRHYAWGTQVRPFRRVLTAQGIYRREVLGPIVP